MFTMFGPGQELAQAQHVDEFLGAEPADALRRASGARLGVHAAEPRQGDLGETSGKARATTGTVFGRRPRSRFFSPRPALFLFARGVRRVVGLGEVLGSPRCVYTCVVEMLECPSISCTARRSPEDCSTWVANECRSMCGCTCLRQAETAAPIDRAHGARSSARCAGRARRRIAPARRASPAPRAPRATPRPRRRPCFPRVRLRVFAPLPVTVDLRLPQQVRAVGDIQAHQLGQPQARRVETARTWPCRAVARVRSPRRRAAAP